jgi:hypothetical protein
MAENQVVETRKHRYPPKVLSRQRQALRLIQGKASSLSLPPVCSIEAHSLCLEVRIPHLSVPKQLNCRRLTVYNQNLHITLQGSRTAQMQQCKTFGRRNTIIAIRLHHMRPQYLEVVSKRCRMYKRSHRLPQSQIMVLGQIRLQCKPHLPHLPWCQVKHRTVCLCRRPRIGHSPPVHPCDIRKEVRSK